MTRRAGHRKMLHPGTQQGPVGGTENKHLDAPVDYMGSYDKEADCEPKERWLNHTAAAMSFCSAGPDWSEQADELHGDAHSLFRDHALGGTIPGAVH